MSDTAPSWLDFLQPASWRGVAFAVREIDNPTGRATAEHQYPYRDVPYVEDLNRATRRYSIRGFLVGDDCYDQEQQMRAAAEAPGPGELIHPVYGSKTVSLVDFSTGQVFEQGRTVSVQFTFVEGGVPLYPSASDSTQNQTSASADAASGQVLGDYNAQVLNATPAMQPVTLAGPDGASTTYGATFA